jgi:hypothetical protein
MRANAEKSVRMNNDAFNLAAATVDEQATDFPDRAAVMIENGPLDDAVALDPFVSGVRM